MHHSLRLRSGFNFYSDFMIPIHLNQDGCSLEYLPEFIAINARMGWEASWQQSSESPKRYTFSPSSWMVLCLIALVFRKCN